METMRPPIFVRSLSDTEKEQLETALRSKDAFVMRRAQVILASDRGERAPQIARSLGCGSQTARDAIHDFNERGLAALAAKSSRPKRTRDAFDEEGAEALRGLLHRSPREFGRRTSLWTLCDGGGGRLRGGAHPEAGLGRDHPGHSFAPARDTLAAGEDGGSPPPTPCTKGKKEARPADGGGRWRIRSGPSASRTSAGGAGWRCPPLSSFSEKGEPHRMIQRSVAKDDPEPKAISCYGLYLPQIGGEMWLRFVDGRPVSGVTTRFLSWCAEELEAAGKKVLLLIWDNASWHISKEVRRWLGKHNREVKKSGEGVRIVSCLLPKQSPWLNAIEPKWVHGKRKVVEFDGLLGTYELAERVCGAFDCPHHEHLTIPQEVA